MDRENQNEPNTVDGILRKIQEKDEHTQTLPKTKTLFQYPSGIGHSEDIATMLRQQDEPTQMHLYG